ncbi:hypothetical protein [Vibrio phage vB_VmeM-Yong XC32]|nr:hypothetical protein [Vibrio phage vB_VmeM-Yong XC31]QAX96490.1 hypothetical protein [Vibrio phage vB_VmeM-Yong XC32]QAX96807.1 hypothetical protein [Vibrio phage vB_VmeM-Yong MS31]QAX97126.1 hypothetical protein [Vibrio phage vB_VmeM-Yong MS32]
MGTRNGAVVKAQIKPEYLQIVQALVAGWTTKEILDANEWLEHKAKYLGDLDWACFDELSQGMMACTHLGKFLGTVTPSMVDTVLYSTYSGRFMEVSHLVLFLDEIASDFVVFFIEDGAMFDDGRFHMAYRKGTELSFELNGATFDKGKWDLDWLSSEAVGDEDLYRPEGQDNANNAVRTHRTAGDIVISNDAYFMVRNAIKEMKEQLTKHYVPFPVDVKWNTADIARTPAPELSVVENERNRPIVIDSLSSYQVRDSAVPATPIAKLIDEQLTRRKKLKAAGVIEEDGLQDGDIKSMLLAQVSSDVTCTIEEDTPADKVFELIDEAARTVSEMKAAEFSSRVGVLTEKGILPEVAQALVGEIGSTAVGFIPRGGRVNSGGMSMKTAMALATASMMANPTVALTPGCKSMVDDLLPDVDVGPWAICPTGDENFFRDPLFSRPQWTYSHVAPKPWEDEKKAQNDAMGLEVNPHKRSRAAIKKSRAKSKQGRKANRKKK